MQVKKEQRVFTSWVLVERDPDATEEMWVSHCLEFDVVSQGNSIRHALDMLAEAVAFAVIDDLQAGLDPTGRGRAPQDAWDKLVDVMKHGEPVKISEMQNQDVLVATQLTLMVDLEHRSVDHPIPADRVPSYASNDSCAFA